MKIFRSLAIAALVLASMPAAALADESTCFCTYPNDQNKFGECAGHEVSIVVPDIYVKPPGQCALDCADQGLTGGRVLNNYDTMPCVWMSRNGVCAGPAAATKPCLDEAKAKAETAGKAVDLSAQGSTVAMPLPFSDISPQAAIGRLIKGALGIVGSLAFLMFVYGGFLWMTAQGDTKKIATAKQTLTWAVLGLVAIFAAYAVLNSLIGGLTTISGS